MNLTAEQQQTENELIAKLGFPAAPFRLEGPILEAVWLLLIRASTEERRLIARVQEQREASRTLAAQNGSLREALTHMRLHAPHPDYCEECRKARALLGEKT